MDKQAHPRTRGRLMVKYGVQRLEKRAFTMNLSVSGAFLKTNDVIRPGTTMQVQVEFPDRKVDLWAQVVWAKKVPPQLAHVLHCGMGIRFVNPGAEWVEFFTEWQAAKKGA